MKLNIEPLSQTYTTDDTGKYLRHRWKIWSAVLEVYYWKFTYTRKPVRYRTNVPALHFGVWLIKRIQPQLFARHYYYSYNIINNNNIVMFYWQRWRRWWWRLKYYTRLQHTRFIRVLRRHRFSLTHDGYSIGSKRPTGRNLYFIPSRIHVRNGILLRW